MIIGETNSLKHACHAHNCTTTVPRRLLMCPRHWRMVSYVTQQRVYRHYQTGQEEGLKTPTDAWHDAADQAIREVAQIELAREGKPRWQRG